MERKIKNNDSKVEANGRESTIIEEDNDNSKEVSNKEALIENKKETKVSKRKTVKRGARGTKLTQADIKKYSQSELDHVILKIKANEIKYTIITVLIILCLLFGGLYLVFSEVQKNVQYNTLTSGALEIDFRETENGLGNIIDLVDVKSYGDSKYVPNSYTFTITNKADDLREYQVFIEDDVDMIAIDNCQDIFLDTSFLRYSINNGIVMSLDKENNNRAIYGTLKAHEKITYTLKVWVSDTYLGKIHYHGKIVVKDSSRDDDDKLDDVVGEDLK